VIGAIHDTVSQFLLDDPWPNERRWLPRLHHT
jgi:hypothetical protein